MEARNPLEKQSLKRIGDLMGSPANQLAEPQLFYDPPYATPVEDEFAWHLVKYLQPTSSLGYRMRLEAFGVRVTLDFVVETESRRVALFLRNGERMAEAEYAAVLVVASGAADAAYLIRETDLPDRLHDVLYLIARQETGLFSLRGHTNLATLASSTAHDHPMRPSENVTIVRYPTVPVADEAYGEMFFWPADAPDDLVIRWLSREFPAGWIQQVDRTLAHYGIPSERPAEGFRRTG